MRAPRWLRAGNRPFWAKLVAQRLGCWSLSQGGAGIQLFIHQHFYKLYLITSFSLMGEMEAQRNEATCPKSHSL